MPRASNRGGQRQGSGRKAKTEAMVPVNQGQEPCIEVKKLTDSQRIVLNLIARGKKAVEASKITGVAQKTISAWRKQPWWDTALQQMTDHLLGHPTEMFGPMVPKALETYEKALEEGDTKVAADIFDRTLGKPLVRQATASVVDVKISISGKGDADVTAYIEQDAVDAEFTVDSEIAA